VPERAVNDREHLHGACRVGLCTRHDSGSHLLLASCPTSPRQATALDQVLVEDVRHGRTRSPWGQQETSRVLLAGLRRRRRSPQRAEGQVMECGTIRSRACEAASGPDTRRLQDRTGSNYPRSCRGGGNRRGPLSAARPSLFFPIKNEASRHSKSRQKRWDVIRLPFNRTPEITLPHLIDLHGGHAVLKLVTGLIPRAVVNREAVFGRDGAIRRVSATASSATTWPPRMPAASQATLTRAASGRATDVFNLGGAPNSPISTIRESSFEQVRVAPGLPVWPSMPGVERGPLRPCLRDVRPRTSARGPAGRGWSKARVTFVTVTDVVGHPRQSRQSLKEGYTGGKVRQGAHARLATRP